MHGAQIIKMAEEFYFDENNSSNLKVLQSS
jgi:hypothetical protein